ncbi:MAG: ABC transporter ATP-binding protein [Acidimicrobiia bacterium]
MAVNDVSFELIPGVTGLLGPNGAGKSTLVRCLAGLSGWDDGEVRIAGIDPTWRAAEARKAIGFMPERVNFPPEMRASEYLRFVAEVKGIARSRRGEVVEVALERAGLTHVASRIVSNLSKGYRQRVGVAQALLGDPPVAILDEPSAGLDPLNVVDIRDVLRRYGDEGRVVFVSTHVLPETRMLCDRVLVMSQGNLVFDGTTAGMATTAREGYRARLRLRAGSANGAAPQIDEPGISLVECTDVADGEYLVLVDIDGEAPLGALVGRLSGSGWSVVGVEPAADAVERAFRQAVVHTPLPDDEAVAP